MDQVRSGLRRWLRLDVMLTLVGIVAGVAGSLLAGRYLAATAAASEARAAQRYQLREVVVASTDVAQGDRLDGGNLAVRKVPRDFLPPDVITAERAAEVVGTRTMIGLSRGTPVVAAALESGIAVRSLSAVLAPDERALTVTVDDVNSHAGAIVVGDEVDLYYGRREAGDAVLVPLLQKVPVLAVGSFAGVDGITSHAYGTITLRVAAAEAPRVLLAQQAGELSVLLRSPTDQAILPASLRSSRELLTRPPGAVASRGIELLTGGSGALIPERTWLAVGQGRSRNMP
jgi:pilus assembly protein CpaB